MFIVENNVNGVVTGTSATIVNQAFYTPPTSFLMVNRRNPKDQMMFGHECITRRGILYADSVSNLVTVKTLCDGKYYYRIYEERRFGIVKDKAVPVEVVFTDGYLSDLIVKGEYDEFLISITLSISKSYTSHKDNATVVDMYKKSGVYDDIINNPETYRPYIAKLSYFCAVKAHMRPLLITLAACIIEEHFNNDWKAVKAMQKRYFKDAFTMSKRHFYRKSSLKLPHFIYKRIGNHIGIDVFSEACDLYLAKHLLDRKKFMEIPYSFFDNSVFSGDNSCKKNGSMYMFSEFFRLFPNIYTVYF